MIPLYKRINSRGSMNAYVSRCTFVGVWGRIYKSVRADVRAEVRFRLTLMIRREAENEISP